MGRKEELAGRAERNRRREGGGECGWRSGSTDEKTMDDSMMDEVELRFIESFWTLGRR